MLVSVIIPTFNRLGKVQRAVDSVLRQSFSDLELIVVDDGSTDGTYDWLSYYTDPRFLVLKVEHGGVAHARNAGVRKAKGEWLCFLDSDDVWHRHKLSEQVRFHMQQPDILISQTDDIWIRNSKRVNKMKKHEIREGSIFYDSLRLCLICCSSVMLQKKMFENVGGFDESLPTCEDYDLWIRILLHHKVGFVPKKLVTKFGGHEDQLSKRFEMMDVYRIQSLTKILSQCFLSDMQKRQIEEEIEYKQKILDKGAEKRRML